MQKSKLKSQNGFTLIEILVVTVILGILLTVAANVFITILRNQNKTALLTEIRQNASVVLDTFERDVRSASGATVVLGPDTVDLSFPDSTLVTWKCVPQVVGISNGKLTRAVGTVGTPGTGVNLTSTDPVNGVNVSSCSISGESGAGPATLLTLDLQMRQGVKSPNKVEFSNTDVEFHTTVGLRGIAR